MKTSNQQESKSSVFVSKELESRIDVDSLLAVDQDSSKNFDNVSDFEQVLIFFKTYKNPCTYKLIAWNENDITVVVPAAHLERFFYMHNNHATVEMFDKVFVGVNAIAQKKNGDWQATISLRT